MAEDAVATHLDLIARLLEAAGYAVEVDYPTAVIIVWLDEWPLAIEVKRRRHGSHKMSYRNLANCGVDFRGATRSSDGSLPESRLALKP